MLIYGRDYRENHRVSKINAELPDKKKIAQDKGRRAWLTAAQRSSAPGALGAADLRGRRGFCHHPQSQPDPAGGSGR